MTDAEPLAIGLDNLRAIALAATGRNWRWNKYHYGTPDLVATVGDPDVYEYEQEVLEVVHDGGGDRRDCHLELNIEPQDAEYIAAAGPDVVLALIDRIRELEAQVTA